MCDIPSTNTTQVSLGIDTKVWHAMLIAPPSFKEANSLRRAATASAVDGPTTSAVLQRSSSHSITFEPVDIERSTMFGAICEQSIVQHSMESESNHPCVQIANFVKINVFDLGAERLSFGSDFRDLGFWARVTIAFYVQHWVACTV